MSIAFFVFCNLFWFALIAFRLYLGWYSSITLLEYQRGFLYRHGLPVSDVGPGRHRLWSKLETIIHLDMRPIQVSYENQQVGLKDGTAAQYSFSATAQINNARKAAYASTNYTQVPAYVLLTSVRYVLNTSSSSELKINRDSAISQIMDRARPRLAGAGFDLLSFRVSQLAIRGEAQEFGALENL